MVTAILATASTLRSELHLGGLSINTVYEMGNESKCRRKEASTQTVHLTVPMLTEMAPETGKTMFGSLKKTLRMRTRCVRVNVSEGDLTSDEKSPWKQLFLCIPFEQARRIIGPGITKFTFHLKHDVQWFEISCLDGTQWCVAQHYAVPKRIAKVALQQNSCWNQQCKLAKVQHSPYKIRSLDSKRQQVIGGRQ